MCYIGIDTKLHKRVAFTIKKDNIECLLWFLPKVSIKQIKYNYLYYLQEISSEEPVF